MIYHWTALQRPPIDATDFAEDEVILSPDSDSPSSDEDGNTFGFAQFILVLEIHPFP